MWRHVFRVLAVLIVLSAVVLGTGLYFLWQDMHESLDQGIDLSGNSELFEIKRGTSLKDLAISMVDKGWLQHPLHLRIEARRTEVATKIQAGTYEIRDRMTPREMLEMFVAGSTATFEIRFIEGMTYREILQVLANTPHLEQTIARMETEQIMDSIGAAGIHPEGWFFPSTYQFKVGARDTDILERAYSRMRDVLIYHWNHRAEGLPYRSAEEVLTMASIIEKETGLGAERREISGVFYRRLKIGMRLQTDPTVIYGIGERFNGNLTRADLRRDTPYNTYTRDGLPPTPIAMPGEAAIEAAVHPAAGDTLYFVAKGDGSHYFSKSLTEHNQAVRRYQLKR